MGLIKTAIMTGGGIYAVKQLTKTAERRHENNNNHNNQQQSSRDPGYQVQQAYWSPGSGPQGQQGKQGPPRPYYQDQRVSLLSMKHLPSSQVLPQSTPAVLPLTLPPFVQHY
ncbi:uncharacterized protein RAG0_07029 [Rhynchosporium agropyri]|uniref:Uncharacterized protein n=1 Tax=Rhynchosporium agropyri TaxID=914238 RepID=A0A1E1KMV7_9HELO|nr:uncharacterized protein RAG0_07029 [Rhynchosporium agropyri]